MLQGAAGDDKRDATATASVMPIPPRLAVEEVLSALNLSATSLLQSTSSSQFIVAIQRAACAGSCLLGWRCSVDVVVGVQSAIHGIKNTNGPNSQAAW